MYDPTSQNKKEEDNEIAESDEDDDDNEYQKEIKEQNLERDRIRYKSEVKFHYVLTETSTIFSNLSLKNAVSIKMVPLPN